MTHTEKIVRALLRVADGKAAALYRSKYGPQQFFTEIDVIITDGPDLFSLIFTKRNEITRLSYNSQVINGWETDTDFLESERWIPPAEFTHWHELMSGWTKATEEEIADEIQARLKASREQRGAPDEERLPLLFESEKAWDRIYAWQPYAYLTIEQQDAFEAAIQPSTATDQ